MCHLVENISTEKGVGVGHLVSILSLISGATSKTGGEGENIIFSSETHCKD